MASFPLPIIRARRVTGSQFWDMKRILLMSFEQGFTLVTETKKKRLFSFTEHCLYNDTWNHSRGFLIASIIRNPPPQIAGKDRRKPRYLLFLNPLSTHCRTSKVCVTSNRVGSFLIVSSMHVYWYRPLHKQLCCWGIVIHTVPNPGENATWGSSKWFSLSQQLLFRPSEL